MFVYPVSSNALNLNAETSHTTLNNIQKWAKCEDDSILNVLTLCDISASTGYVITEQVIPGDLQLVLFPVKFVFHIHNCNHMQLKSQCILKSTYIRNFALNYRKYHSMQTPHMWMAYWTVQDSILVVCSPCATLDSMN
jgi:hypothetical protein